MSEGTKIEWATHTFNPWIGCTKVSPGCAHCYAEQTTRARVLRSQGQETWGKGKPRSRTSAAMWKNPLKWNRAANATSPRPSPRGGEGGDRPRVFPSLCDWLDAEVPSEWLADFLKLVHDTQNLDWLLLTKRPENFRRHIGSLLSTMFLRDDWRLLWLEEGKAPENVWIGTSVEDKKRADERIPELLKIPAKVRFLSVEPLLGPVDLKLIRVQDRTVTIVEQIHWVIVGGESGPKARPCNIEWIRDIVRQCKAACVPCFVKQLGSNPAVTTYSGDMGIAPENKRGFRKSISFNHPKGGDMAEWPEDLRVRQFPDFTSPRPSAEARPASHGAHAEREEA